MTLNIFAEKYKKVENSFDWEGKDIGSVRLNSG